MASPIDQAIVAYLRRSIAAGRDTERIGPFLASFSRATKNPFLNYAIPDDDAAPIPARRAGVRTPFLMANEAEARFYARVGFEPVSEVLLISR